MTTIRAFMAIELSSQARDALTTLQNRLKTVVPPRAVRWTSPQNIHLTLHFLGNVSAGAIENVETVLRETGGDCPPFSLTLRGLGCFPNIKRPRVVCVGATGDIETLGSLHRALGQRLKAATGYTPDSRPYSPHLTLGRVKKGLPLRHMQQLAELLAQEQQTVGSLATLNVGKIGLIKSELTPTGPIYTTLLEETLKGRP